MTYWHSEQETGADTVPSIRDTGRQEAASLHRESSKQEKHHQQQPEQGKRAPIGIFDSGVGGLTILTALKRQLPHEDFIYFGDTAHNPYGARNEEDITTLTVQACRFLSEQGVKMIVIACNTASQAALNTLRATFTLPIIGVVPAVKPAARMTRRGRIGVAATNRASQAAYLRQLIDDFAEGIEVYTIGAPELVVLVEQGRFDGPEVEAVLHKALQPLLAQQVDVIVLGCTHFPALRPAIERVAGKQVQIIDSGTAIARRASAVLDAEDLLQSTERKGELQLWCSGDPVTFSNVASKLLGYPVTAQQITL